MNSKEHMDKDSSDEIDLYDLFLVLKRRSKLILLFFMLGLVIAGVISILSPDIYQAKATLWVDTLHSKQIVESRKEGTNRFVFNINLGHTKSVDVIKFSISTLNSLEFKKKIFKNFKDTHDFKADVDKKTEVLNLTSEAKDKKTAEDILHIAIKEFETNFNNFHSNYEKKMKAIYNHDFEKIDFLLYVIEQPASFDEPVRPKRNLIFAISGVSSLLLGVFFAFLVDWWAKSKARKEDTKCS